MIRLSVVGLGVFLAGTAALGAQEARPLFSGAVGVLADQAVAAMSVRSAKPVLDRRVVGMDLDHLFDPGTRRVRLNVGSHDWVAAFERVDQINGARAWTGSIEGIDHSHVSIAERDGAVSGLINAVGELYAVQTVSAGVYTLDRIQEAGKELQPIVPEPVAVDASTLPPGAWSDTADFIDVLIVYTPGARLASCPVEPCTDAQRQANINAKVAQVISDTNSAYQRSGVTTRVRLAAAAELDAQETSDMGSDLTALRTNATAQAMRDAAKADLVLLLQDALDVTACGLGYLLTAGNASGFAPFAYAIADIYVGCVYTTSHEMGHNQGSNHDFENASGGGAFSYSYGYADGASPSPFRTIMAYECSPASCPRILNFSNPAVVNTVNGRVTGTAAANNAASLNGTALTVANFRPSSAPPTGVPGAPTGLNAVVNGFDVTISWNPVLSDPSMAAAAATGYAIDVGTASNVFNIYSNLNVGNTTNVSGRGPAGTYFWTVKGYNSAGVGAAAAQSSFTLPGGCPGAPQNFTHTVSPSRLVSLSWSAPATGTGPFSYLIDVGLVSGQTVLSLPVGTLTAQQVQAPPGTYFVRIRASNGCGPGAPSAERTIVVP